MHTFKLLSLLPATLMAASVSAQDHGFQVGELRIEVRAPVGAGAGPPTYRFVQDGQLPGEGWRRTDYGVHVRLLGVPEPSPIDPLDPPERDPGLVALFPESPRESRLVIVQYFTPPVPKYRELFAAAEVEEGRGTRRPAELRVVGPLSGNAELVFAKDQAALDWLRQRVVERGRAAIPGVEPFLRAVLVYRPEFRLEPNLQAEALRAGDAAQGSRTYALQTLDANPRTKAVVVEQILETGGVVNHLSASGLLIRATLRWQQLRALSARGEIQAIEEWAPPGGHGAAGGSGPGRLLDLVRKDGGADVLEDASITGEDLLVHVIDTGLCPHEALPDGTVSVELGAENSYGGWGWQCSHGTQSVGVLAMHGSPGMPRGVLEGCQVQFSTMGAIVNGDRMQVTADRVDAGCLVESNSWGLTVISDGYNSYARDLDEIAAENDILIAQSMGDASRSKPNKLAWARNVVTVGAIDHNDSDVYEDHQLYATGLQGQASAGDSPESLVKPDLCFWADQIETTWAPDDCGSWTGTGAYSGASASTPQVAGYAGLVHALWRAGSIGPGAAAAPPRPATVRALLVHGANPYAIPLSEGEPGFPRHQQGWGRPNVENLLHTSPFILDADGSYALGAPGEERTWSSPLGQGAESLRITMAYTDRALDPLNGQVVNDLGLEVIAPDGTTYFGNHGLATSNWSTPTTYHQDPYNTIENVFLSPDVLAAHEKGTWLVTVRAEALYLGSTDYDEVPFALVITGLDDPLPFF